jgi:hypothetical protein
MFGMAFKQPLRQTQGLMRSIADVLGVEVAAPEFSTLSRRGNGLCLSASAVSKTAKQAYLVVGSTGLKIFGEDDWLEEKHKNRKRRSWRKLRLGLDLVSGQIVCSDLTKDDVGDLPALLERIDGPVDLFLAAGAYDGGSTRDILEERFGTTFNIAIPPPKNAVLRLNAALHPTVRDRNIAETLLHKSA